MPHDQFLRLIEFFNYILIFGGVFSPIPIGWGWMEFQELDKYSIPAIGFFTLYLFIYLIVSTLRIHAYVIYGV